MGRTIGIAVGCAAAYIVLVVGLMIYCKGRRARQSKKEEVMAPECENRKFLYVVLTHHTVSGSSEFFLIYNNPLVARS